MLHVPLLAKVQSFNILSLAQTTFRIQLWFKINKILVNTEPPSKVFFSFAIVKLWVILLSHRIIDAGEMVLDLEKQARKVGLKVNINKV